MAKVQIPAQAGIYANIYRTAFLKYHHPTIFVLRAATDKRRGELPGSYFMGHL
jgi:hypothetical protein